MPTETHQPKNRLVKLRPDTRDKFDRIASARRWTLVETADALADHFLATDPQMQAGSTDPNPLPGGTHLDTTA